MCTGTWTCGRMLWVILVYWKAMRQAGLGPRIQDLGSKAGLKMKLLSLATYRLRKINIPNPTGWGEREIFFFSKLYARSELDIDSLIHQDLHWGHWDTVIRSRYVRSNDYILCVKTKQNLSHQYICSTSWNNELIFVKQNLLLVLV